MTFEEWFAKEFPEHDFGTMYSKGVIRGAWQAAQTEERKREKGLVDALKACDEAMDYISEYDIPLGLPQKVKAAIAKYEEPQ